MNIAGFLRKIKHTKNGDKNVKTKNNLTFTEIAMIGLASVVVLGAVAYIISNKKIDKKEEKELDQREQMLELESVL